MISVKTGRPLCALNKDIMKQKQCTVWVSDPKDARFYNSWKLIVHIISWCCVCSVLGGNPLWCDCNLKWVSDWIKQGQESGNYRENGVAKCDGPERLRNKLLLTTSTNSFQCDKDYNASHILSKCDACSTKPCKNSARCVSTSYESFECQCEVGYYGELCQFEIDACFGHPCENNGRCRAVNGRFHCTCQPGFEGHRCEINIDDCVNHECQNGATCMDVVQDYVCKCPLGYSGKHCENSVNLCNELQPCRNGAKCTPTRQDYVCECSLGFNDKNCSTNINDCIGNICQNGAHCIDGLGEYSCECGMSFTGKYCEIKTTMRDAPQSSVCQNSNCQNGAVCFQLPGSSEYECRCAAGYEGKKCEKLGSVTFHTDSYVQSPSLDFSQLVNITIVFSTESDKGVLLYQGTTAHIAAEVFRGRVRVSFHLGNFPIASTMFSYKTVNDDKIHTLQIIVNLKNLTMMLDDASPQSIVDDGDIRYLESISNFYLGGLHGDIRSRVLEQWQVRYHDSFKGCYRAVYVNNRKFDFSDAQLSNHKVLPGCGEDPCMNNLCVNGRCVPEKETMDYTCRCSDGWTGSVCDESEPTCRSEVYKDHYVDPDTGCRSKGKVKLKRCVGDESCVPRSMRKKNIKMRCDDNRIYMKEIGIVRKCSRSKRRHWRTGSLYSNVCNT